MEIHADFWVIDIYDGSGPKGSNWMRGQIFGCPPSVASARSIFGAAIERDSTSSKYGSGSTIRRLRRYIEKVQYASARLNID